MRMHAHILYYFYRNINNRGGPDLTPFGIWTIIEFSSFPAVSVDQCRPMSANSPRSGEADME